MGESYIGTNGNRCLPAEVYETVVREESMGEPEKLTRTFVLSNKLGLHARPASIMAKTAKLYSAKVTVDKDGTQADARSILSLLTLAAGQGSQLTLMVEGDDAAEAMNALEKIITNRFGED